MMKRMTSRRNQRKQRQARYTNDYDNETKSNANNMEDDTNQKGLDHDWTTKGMFQVEEVSCMAALDVRIENQKLKCSRLCHYTRL